MRRFKVKFYLLCCIGLSWNYIHGQQTTLTSGGEAKGNGGFLSYSVGQSFFSTVVTSEGSIQEGNQQPFEISEITGNEQMELLTLQCVVYPNPTSDYLKFLVNDYKGNSLSYRLYDINGKLIDEKSLLGKELILIRTAALPSATYLLQILDDNQEIKTFKIFKNK